MGYPNGKVQSTAAQRGSPQRRRHGHRGSDTIRLRGDADDARVFQSHPGRQRRRAQLEESHLQDHRPSRRAGARLLPHSQLPRTPRIKPQKKKKKEKKKKKKKKKKKSICTDRAGTCSSVTGR